MAYHDKDVYIDELEKHIRRLIVLVAYANDFQAAEPISASTRRWHSTWSWRVPVLLRTNRL